MTSLKLGVVTTNYPPMIGGMSSHAAGLIQQLRKLCEIYLVARCTGNDEKNKQRRQSDLSLCPDVRLPDSFQERRRIVTNSSERVDAWLALSCDLAPLGPLLNLPFFVYCHGNDILQPNPDPLNTWGHRVANRAVIWRLAPALNAMSRWVNSNSRWEQVRDGLVHASHVFVNSENTKNVLKQTYRLNTLDVTVCPPGCDDKYFQDHAPRSSLNDPYRLLTVSRLSTDNRRKNVDNVLRGLGRIGSTIPWEYHVVGDGDDRERLEKMANDLGLATKVVFHGRVGDQQLLDQYRNADLFILMSKATDKDVEGFGMVYIEANAAGVPVLASRAGGATDAIQPEITGHLRAGATPEDVEEGILHCYEKSQYFDNNAIKQFAEKFRWERIAEQLYRKIETNVKESTAK